METSYQVVVVGGGPAGVVAAIAAAENGARTLLVEQSGCLGGVATSGLLSVLGPFDDGDRRLDWEKDNCVEKGLPLTDEMKVANRVIKGIPERLLRELTRLGGATDYGYGFIPVNPEVLKYAAEAAVLKAGVHCLYHTLAHGVVRKGDRLTAVVLGNKSGVKEVGGDVFVDATGDADLVAYAGARWEKGRVKDGKMQGVTLVFRMGGVKMRERFYTRREAIKRANAQFEDAYKRGGVATLHRVGCINHIPGMPGVVSVNTQHTYEVDGTDAEDVTRALVKGRKDVMELARLFKAHLEGFEESYLLDTAACLGVRETRRIVGDYVLTRDDVLSSWGFADSIGRNAYNLDIHMPDEDVEVDDNIFLKPGTSYGIPYRCLLPVEMSNVLVAGRAISSTHEAQSSIRIMPCCMVTGEAAGTAAALAVRRKTTPRELDTDILQRQLQTQGAVI